MTWSRGNFSIMGRTPVSSAKRSVGVGGDAGSPALNGFAPEKQMVGRDLNRVGARAYDYHFASGAEAGDQLGRGLTAGGCGENYLGATELLELLSSVGSGAVDVNAGAEFLGEGLAFFAARDSGDAIAELGGELHAEMSEAADAEDGY